MRLVKSPSPLVKLFTLSTNISSGLITLAFNITITNIAATVAKRAKTILATKELLWLLITVLEASLTSFATILSNSSICKSSCS